MMGLKQAWLVVLFSIALSSFLYGQTADELLSSGSAAFTAGKYAQAAGAFESFLSGYGSSAEGKKAKEKILPLLVASYIQLNKGAEAEPLIESYLKDYPQGTAISDMMFWLGLSRFMQKNFTEAEKALRDFIQKQPSAEQIPEARMLLATALFEEKKFSEAAAIFNEASQSKEPLTSERALLMRLQSYIELQDMTNAFAALEKLLAKTPPVSQQALLSMQAFQLGDLFYGVTNFEKAYRCYLFVPQKAQILAQQEVVLKDVEAQLDRIAGAPPGGMVMRLQQTKDALIGERAALEKMAGFDYNRHLRLAQCALQAGRLTEGYLAASVVAEATPPGAINPVGHYLAILSCMEMKRWSRVHELIVSFVTRYPNDSRAPQIAYLQGSAYMEAKKFNEAYETFLKHSRTYPNFSEADRVLFLAGYCALFVEKNKEADDIFLLFKTKYKNSPLLENNFYWYGMSSVFTKNHLESRNRFSKYLEDYPQGVYKEEALYRIAAAYYGEKNYAEAHKRLTSWLKDFTGHVLTDEVRALMGDVLFAEEETEEGIKVYRQIGPGSPSLFEYATFQIGRAYKLLEQPEDMVTHYKAYVQVATNSARIVEGYHWIGWALRQLERIDEARQVYREALERFGSERDKPYVEEIFFGYAKLYTTPEEKEQLIDELRKKETSLLAADQKIFAARCVWLLAQLQRKTNPDASKAAMMELVSKYKPTDLSAQLLVDVGEMLVTDGKMAEAEPYFNRLTEAYPRGRYKDRALAGLGLIAASKGELDKALAMYDRFEREVTASLLLPKVLESKVEILLKQNRNEETIKVLEKILETKIAKGKPWVRALYQLGQIHELMGKHKEATAYYERIYVLYGKYRDWVAKAYFARGQALEKMNLRDKAKETYQAMIAESDLAEFPEFQKAQERLATL